MRHGHLRQSREGRAAPRTDQVRLTRRHVEVVRTYLALDDPTHLRPAATSDPRLTFDKLAPCPVELYRRLYRDVGADWYWHDRLDWSDDELAHHLSLATVAVCLVRYDGDAAGYFELLRHEDGSAEIVYFGLLARYIGRGLGGPTLTRAVREASDMGATRVWLHTCTLDSPRALPSYQARGFRAYRTERLAVEIEGSRVVSEQLLKG